MKLFISWSGDRSRIVAEALRSWIPDIIQAVKPWVSGVDIRAGTRWSREVEQQLLDTRFGILCLTKENQTAFSKRVRWRRVSRDPRCAPT